MFKFRKTENSDCTLKTKNVIGIKSNFKNQLPMAFVSMLMVLLTIYCIAKIELESFRIFEYIPSGPYYISFSQNERKEFYAMLLLFSGVIAFVNAFRKIKARWIAAVAGVYLLVFGRSYKYAANGFVHCLNKAIYAVGQTHGKRIDIYYLTYFEISDPKTEVKYFIFALLLGTCFLISYAAAKRCIPILYTVCVSFYAALPFMCNTFDGEWKLVPLGIMCIMLFLMKFQGYSNNPSRKIIAEFNNSVKIKGRYSSFASCQLIIIMAALSAILMFSLNVFFELDTFKKSDKVDEFGRDLIYSFENFSFAGRLGSFTGKSSGLNNGDLTKMGNLSYTGEIMFEIKTQDPKQTAPLYLRSFTAANYSNERWKPLEKEVYSAYGFWNAFEEDGFYPQFLYGELSERYGGKTVKLSIIDKKLNPKTFLTEYRISPKNTDILNKASINYDNELMFDNFGGVKSYDQEIVVNNDYLTGVFAEGDFENIGNAGDLLYSGDFYTASASPQFDENAFDHNEYNKFLNNEKLYRQFVVDNYLGCPDNIENYLPEGYDELLNAVFNSYLYDYEYDENGAYFDLSERKTADPNIINAYYSAAISYIKDYLHSQAEYTLEPGATPPGKDVIGYFLNENHKGYCVHFATAATLMLRRAGIPARYAEGYYVSEYNLRAVNDAGYSGIPDSNAHAWTEVYYPLFGWRAVDFTPYYSENILPEENKTQVYSDVSSDRSSDSDSDSETDTDTASDSDTETDTDTALDTDTETQTDTETDSSAASDQSDSSADKEISVQISSSDDDGSDNKLSNGFLKVLSAASKTFGTAVIIFAVWFGIKLLVAALRKMRFHTGDSRKNVSAMYRHMLWILKIGGVVPKKGESDRNLALRAAKEIEGLTKENCVSAVNTALSSGFGKNPPSDRETAKMEEFLKELSSCIYASSGRCKKLIIKYILFLN